MSISILPKRQQVSLLRQSFHKRFGGRVFMILAAGDRSGILNLPTKSFSVQKPDLFDRKI